METKTTKWYEADATPDTTKGRIIIYMGYVSSRNAVQMSVKEAMNTKMASYATAIVKDWENAPALKFCSTPSDFKREGNNFKIIAWMYEADLLPMNIR